MSKLLSVGVMCGDEHSGEALQRCLSSILNMKKGCPADEIVVGFNGKDGAKLAGTLQGLGYQSVTDPGVDYDVWVSAMAHVKLPLLKVISYLWPGRFDDARNAYWKHLDAEWLLSIDADDRLADAENPEDLKAIMDVERDYKLAPSNPNAPSLTTREWLASLPPQINTIFVCYDYATDESGYVVTRQKAKRLVRKSVGHVWWAPNESGVHENLFPAAGVPETAISNLGILMRHSPTQDARERAVRNISIVKTLTTSNKPTDARHAFDVANSLATVGDFERADIAVRAAIEHAANNLDRYTFRLARGTLQFLRGLPEAAMGEAFAAIALDPGLQEAYLVASDACFRMGQWSGCVEWFERGAAKSPVLLQLDQPLMRFTQPRLQAALSHLQLDQPEEAYKLTLECMGLYPKSALVQQVHEQASSAMRDKKLGKALLDACEILSDEAPAFAGTILTSLKDYAPTRALARGLATRTLLAKVDRVDLAVWDDPKDTRGLLPTEGEWSFDEQRIELQDALNHGMTHEGKQILKYEQRGPKKAYVKTRLVSRGLGIAFYCPSAVEQWTPQALEGYGLGGSESSVAYLARELGKLGRRVEVYTPHPTGSTLSLWSGTHRDVDFSVVQKDYSLVNDVPDSWHIIACRAPYLAREQLAGWKMTPEKALERIWCWHQDNGYGSPWLWSEDVANRQRHLHVSYWARLGLLKEAGLTDRHAHTAHETLGNGIPPECAEGWGKVERHPHRVIYASDPSRGLEMLLDAWPKIRAQVPDAELHLYCGFKVMLTLKQDKPGMTVVERVESIKKRCESMGELGVKLVGWQPQAVVIEAMKAASLYVYPGGPMPEGFGVSLVQAQACGCEVLCSGEGALPEVLGDGCYTLTEKSAEGIVSVTVPRLLNPLSLGARSGTSAGTLELHGWDVVAKRFLKLIDDK